MCCFTKTRSRKKGYQERCGSGYSLTKLECIKYCVQLWDFKIDLSWYLDIFLDENVEICMIDQISFVYVYHQNTLLTMFMDRDDHRLIGLSPLPKKTPWILFEFICSYVVKQK